MKRTLVLLMAAFSAAAYAQPQPVYRCEDSLRNVSYQGTPCATPPRADRPGAPSDPFLEAPNDPLGDWNTREPTYRLSTRKEELAMASRVLELQKPLNDRQAAQYAENRNRCEVAMRVADRCGKFAGTFYCDEKGFQPIPQDAAIKPVVMDNGSRYKMERCALEAAKGGP